MDLGRTTLVSPHRVRVCRLGKSPSHFAGRTFAKTEWNSARASLGQLPRSSVTQSSVMFRLRPMIRVDSFGASGAAWTRKLLLRPSLSSRYSSFLQLPIMNLIASPLWESARNSVAWVSCPLERLAHALTELGLTCLRALERSRCRHKEGMELMRSRHCLDTRRRLLSSR